MRKKPWLVLSTALMAAYLAYIIWAKLTHVVGARQIALGDVGEFWLFFASILAFTVQVVADERRTRAGQEQAGQP